MGSVYRESGRRPWQKGEIRGVLEDYAEELRGSYANYFEDVDPLEGAATEALLDASVIEKIMEGAFDDELPELYAEDHREDVRKAVVRRASDILVEKIESGDEDESLDEMHLNFTEAMENPDLLVDIAGAEQLLAHVMLEQGQRILDALEKRDSEIKE